MASVFQELRRRNVFRVAAAYLILAWLVLQITDLVAPPLGLPDWTMSMVIFLGFVGFPFALLFAWAFELTPDGIKRSGDVEPGESITKNTARKVNQITTALLISAVIILLLDRQLGLSEHWNSETDTSGVEVLEKPELASAAVEPTQEVAEPPRSIAVLPFVNMSGDAEQEYFSDGISEELLNALAKIRELRVAARTSSFAFKGKNQDITEIGEKLKVATVLEGSVRKSGQRVRITAQLINVEDGYHLWSEAYDRDLTDIFAVQDEISAAIVSALKVHLANDTQLASTTQVDVKAYNWFLQGRQNVRRRDGDALRIAVKQFQKAVELEPGYADAWAGLGMATLLLRDDQYGTIPPADAATEAQGYLDRSFAIDPGLSIAHGAQSLLYQTVGDDEKALASIDRAIAANPSEGVWHMWQSQALEGLGREEEARRSLVQAYEVDPLHPAIRANLSRLLVTEKQYAQARAMAVPGTASYYGVEFLIAEQRGEWARIVEILEEWERETTEGATQRERLLGNAKVGWLKEMDAEPGQLFHMNRVLYNPQAVIDKYLGEDPRVIGPGIRHMFLVALAMQKRCPDILEYLAPLELNPAKLEGSVGTHDDFGLSVIAAECKAVLGKREEAGKDAAALLSHYQEYMARIGPERAASENMDLVHAVLLFLSGQAQAAREILDQSLENGQLYWSFYREYPSTILYADDPTMQSLKPALQQRLNSERGKLGWPPVEL